MPTTNKKWPYDVKQVAQSSGFSKANVQVECTGSQNEFGGAFVEVAQKFDNLVHNRNNMGRKVFRAVKMSLNGRKQFQHTIWHVEVLVLES